MGELGVVHIDTGREWRGGQHQVSLLVEGLARRGVRQIVATPAGSPLAERLAGGNAEILKIDFKGELDRAAGKRLAGVAREFGADLLHAHTAHAHAIGIGAHKRLRRGVGGRTVRLVVSRRVDFAVGRGFFSRRKYRYPHQHYIAISEGVCRVLIEGGVASEKIDVVVSGVPPIAEGEALERGQAREELGIARDAIAIGTVGALTDHKGHRYLIDAAAWVIRREPRAMFWILGEGELRGKLEHQILDAGLQEYVFLPGYIEDARLKLRAFDLYVSSSHLEGLGTSILDAMLAGVPVVAADAGGVSEIVRPGTTGRLVAARDASALAEAIAAELATPEETRRKAAGDARAFAELNFSAEQMVERTLGVYQRLCE